MVHEGGQDNDLLSFCPFSSSVDTTVNNTVNTMAVVSSSSSSPFEGGQVLLSGASSTAVGSGGGGAGGGAAGRLCNQAMQLRKAAQHPLLHRTRQYFDDEKVRAMASVLADLDSENACTIYEMSFVFCLPIGSKKRYMLLYTNV